MAGEGLSCREGQQHVAQDPPPPGHSTEAREAVPVAPPGNTGNVTAVMGSWTLKHHRGDTSERDSRDAAGAASA